MPRSKHPQTPIPMFWDNVNHLDKLIEDPDHCWLWQGRTDAKGYGRLQWRQMNFAAHRLSYAIHYGWYAPWILILHRCDTPACWRPDHLFLGTHQDNVDDMIAKGHYKGRVPNLRPRCKHGHEYTSESSYVHPKNGHRICRECSRIRHRIKQRERRKTYYAARRAEKIIAKLATQPSS